MAGIFGFTIGKKEDKSKKKIESIVPPSNDDGSIISAYSAYGLALDLDGVVKDENQLIRQYRIAADYPDCSSAIDDITNEAITFDGIKSPVSINLDGVKYSEGIKNKIRDEFNGILSILDFNKKGYDFFRQWYIDGRMYFHIVLDKDNLKNGIVEVRYIDPRKIRKIKEVKKVKDASGNDVHVDGDSYYLYNDKGFTSTTNQGIKLSTDSVIYVNSGLIDSNTGLAKSYLHKCVKLVNQLKMAEDAMIIYRYTRAPERRVFYIDVGSLPKIKADQYVQDTMARFRNKLVYNSTTGEISEDRKSPSMIEDYWMPRRDGCFDLSTKIKLLDGRDVELGQLIVEHNAGKENWVYSVSPTGKVVPGLISWAGVTRNDATIVDVYLDNGQIVTCTPDHKFILRNGLKVEAKDLSAGISLMPCDVEKRVLYENKDYNYVFDNESNKWITTHKMVSSFAERNLVKNEVVHHIDFNRFNNNPSNLVIMDKDDHFKLHSGYSTHWRTTEKVDEWKLKLSESGKAFFLTENGLARKEEISKFNAECENVWKGLKLGREHITESRNADKLILSKEEYLKKWSPGFTKEMPLIGSVASEKRKIDKEILSETEFNEKWKKNLANRNEAFSSLCKSYDFNVLVESIKQSYYPNIKNSEIVEIASSIYPNLSSKKSLSRALFEQGYDSISDFVIRNFDEVGKRRSYKAKSLNNHKVLKVVTRTDTIDVGTLTIDEQHIHHDYHNFALSSGIFVMNSKGTEIVTLPGGQSLGQIDDVVFFQNKLYKSLNVPASRLTPESGFNIGRSSEISRDEVKFAKFIGRLRHKFTALFIDLLRVQTIGKGIVSSDDWEELERILYFEFAEDNHYAELKDNEIIQGRIQTLQLIDPYVGKYYSVDWIRKNVLHQTEEEIKQIDKENKEDSTLQANAEQQTSDQSTEDNTQQTTQDTQNEQ